MPTLAANGVGPVEAALIGACGAVVGGFLTSAANVFTDWRRSRREAEAERRAIGRELRRAARLTADELTVACGALRAAVEAAYYWDTASNLGAASWDEGRGILAAELPDGAWTAVASAYEELRRVDRLVAERARRLPPGRRPPVEPQDRLDAAIAAMREAEAILRATGGSAEPERR